MDRCLICGISDGHYKAKYFWPESWNWNAVRVSKGSGFIYAEMLCSGCYNWALNHYYIIKCRGGENKL